MILTFYSDHAKTSHLVRKGQERTRRESKDDDWRSTASRSRDRETTSQQQAHSTSQVSNQHRNGEQAHGAIRRPGSMASLDVNCSHQSTSSSGLNPQGGSSFALDLFNSEPPKPGALSQSSSEAALQYAGVDDLNRMLGAPGPSTGAERIQVAEKYVQAWEKHFQATCKRQAKDSSSKPTAKKAASNRR